MEWFRKETSIDFMGLRRWSAMLSVALMVISIGVLMSRGINWGLDFTGGIVVEMHYTEAPDLDQLRNHLEEAGFRDAIVQNLDSTRDVMIRLAPREEAVSPEPAVEVVSGLSAPQNAEQKAAAQVKSILHKVAPDAEVSRIDVVGSQVGQELAENGALAVLVALILTMIYISFRFEHRFAIGAAVALAHDPILIMGIFSLYQIEFDLPTLAAILAVIGYSLNDTIVVFDRVKENFVRLRKEAPLDVMNISINQTLSRTIMTSGLTLLVVISLLVVGGSAIHGFSVALLIGIVIGTYSSIYIAGALSVALGLTRKDLMPVPKQEVDSMP